MKTFGDTIKQLRIDSKLSQKEVAENLDIDASLLAKYERNIRYPSKQFILKIAQFFNVDSIELISEAVTDKIANQFLKENIDSALLRVAENKVEYIRSKK